MLEQKLEQGICTDYFFNAEARLLVFICPLPFLDFTAVNVLPKKIHTDPCRLDR